MLNKEGNLNIWHIQQLSLYIISHFCDICLSIHSSVHLFVCLSIHPDFLSLQSLLFQCDTSHQNPSVRIKMISRFLLMNICKVSSLKFSGRSGAVLGMTHPCVNLNLNKNTKYQINKQAAGTAWVVICQQSSAAVLFLKYS